MIKVKLKKSQMSNIWGQREYSFIMNKNCIIIGPQSTILSFEQELIFVDYLFMYIKGAIFL
jgi:hypothetical protein